MTHWSVYSSIATISKHYKLKRTLAFELCENIIIIVWNYNRHVNILKRNLRNLKTIYLILLLNTLPFKNKISMPSLLAYTN
jgi:hypothetical protein